VSNSVAGYINFIDIGGRLSYILPAVKEIYRPGAAFKLPTVSCYTFHSGTSIEIVFSSQMLFCSFLHVHEPLLHSFELISNGIKLH
jgi:hypothetical protein